MLVETLTKMSKAYVGAKLEALLTKHSCQMQEKLFTLGITQQSISHRLKSLRVIQKQENRVTHESHETINIDIAHLRCCLLVITKRLSYILYSLILKN